jgi:integrative and conjugative element protein (TIGR02256 family)
MEEIDFGKALADLEPERLRFDGSRALLAACLRHPNISVRELRALTRADGTIADGIVIDVDNRQVPARNPSGIRACEPLLLVHDEGASLPYEARALRVNFPVLLHQNSVPEGDPLSLCLYEQPWSAVERSWTPSRFLDRILWWLGRSACGDLHGSDQSLEQLFYDNGLRLVLPTDFESAWVATRAPMQLAQIKTHDKLTLRPVPPLGDQSEAMMGLVATIGAVGHPPLTRHPTSLGALADYFARLGSGLMGPLGAAIAEYWPQGTGAIASPKQRTLVILRVPRDAGNGTQRTDTSAVLLVIDPGTLGLMLGVLDRDPESRRLFRSYGSALSGQAPITSESWRDIELVMTQTVHAISRADSQIYSGILGDHRDFKGVLGGAGSLGSALFNIWFRAGWGQWTLVDDDTIAPHNLVRHTAADADIGLSKVKSCAELGAMIYPAEPPTDIVESRIDATDDAEVRSAIESAELVVDATATLSAGRNLSVAEHAARTASVFFSPSGRASILLLEDRARRSRLIALEAQYYRAILNEPWGETHLAVSGVVRPGATCRDLSFVLPLEQVQLQAAILAQQLRASAANEAPRVGVWIQDDNGGVTAVDIPVMEDMQIQAADWTIGWDTGLHQRLRALRRGTLPSETGGVLLGIIDTALKRIQVVDVVPAPTDSIGSTSEFIRGTQGLEQAEAEARRRTQGAVEYVGEWHSHPPGHSTQPSLTDVAQVVALVDRLDAEDIPGLICIVGGADTDLSWTLGRQMRASHFLSAHAPVRACVQNS